MCHLTLLIRPNVNGSTRLRRSVRLQSMIWRSSATIVRFGLALALSLWIAGAGCMFGCESMVAAAQEPRGATEAQSTWHKVPTAVSGHACDSAESHDCCVKARKAVTGRTETPETVGVASEHGLPPEMMRCPLAVNGAAVITKTSKQIVAPVALSRASLPPENTFEQNAALSPPSRLPNRGHTYLCCCVFLI